MGFVSQGFQKSFGEPFASLDQLTSKPADVGLDCFQKRVCPVQQDKG